MNPIITIFKKELKDSLRDRRTIMTMVVLPLLLFPLLIGLSSKFMMSHVKKEQAKILKVGLLTRGNAQDLVRLFEENEQIKVIAPVEVDEGQALIKSDSLDAYLVFHADFDQRVTQGDLGSLNLYIKETEEREIQKHRIQDVLDEFENLLRAQRFERMNLSPTIHETLSVKEINLATAKEQMADVIGGFLPYMFILFCFMGAMYPAIDLAAGEKERGTLETLLTSPVSKMQILMGKFGVVVLTGIGSAMISLLGMYIGIRQVDEIPEEFFNMIMSLLEPQAIAQLITLLLPLTIFFAAILLSVSFMAKSFKEAQSMITPFNFVVIVPAFIGMMPGMNLNATTAIIPILNVSLASKAIVAGQVDAGAMALVYASLVVYAAISLFFCTKTFGNESAIFR